jgi:hypothetical protein
MLSFGRLNQAHFAARYVIQILSERSAEFQFRSGLAYHKGGGIGIGRAFEKWKRFWPRISG